MISNINEKSNYNTNLNKIDYNSINNANNNYSNNSNNNNNNNIKLNS
jgi:hypothetical protein